MVGYRDMTFCLGENCNYKKGCYYLYTEKIQKEADEHCFGLVAINNRRCVVGKEINKGVTDVL